MGAGYHIPNIHGDLRTVCTNHSHGVPFRSFGSVESYLAFESLMDELAEKMGMDPLELRYLNVYRPGSTTPHGSAPEVYPFPEMFDTLRPHYQEALKRTRADSTADVKKGVGVALGIFPCGLGGPDNSSVYVELTPEGDVKIYHAWEDHGQGADMGVLGTAHECLRPLGLTPGQDQAGGVRHGVDTQSRTCRRQPAADHHRQRDPRGLRPVDGRHEEGRRHLPDL